MKKLMLHTTFKTSFRFFTLLIFMVICVGNAWGAKYIIVFKTGSSDFTNLISADTNLKAVIANGAEYVSGFTSSCDNAYYPSINGIKLGTSKDAGTLELNIAPSYQSNIKKITIISAQYLSDNGTLAVYNGSCLLESVIQPGGNYTIAFATAVNVSSLKITTSTKRAYISQIILETTPTRQVCFYSNGTLFKQYSNMEEGDNIEFPNEKPADINGKAFVGWYETNYSDSKVAPKFVTSAKMGENDISFHAVFATATASGSIWTKTAASAVTAGTYAIITTDGHSFNGTIKDGHGQETSTVFSFNDKNIAYSAPDSTLEITIATSDSGFTMYNATKGYLYAKAAASGNLNWSKESNSYWFCNSNNNIDYWVYRANYAYLRSNYNTFRTYSGGGGYDIQFTKKDIKYTYSDYCTTIPEFIQQTNLNLAAEYSNRYWSTFSSDQVTFFPNHAVINTVNISNSTLSVSAISSEATIISGEKVTGYFIPANTGVLLYAYDNSIEYYTVTNKSITNLENNMLYPASLDKSELSNHLFYKLSYYDSNMTQLGFYWGTTNGGEFATKPGAAYLAVPTSSLVKGWSFDEMETLINDVDANVDVDNVIYNLSGQRITKYQKGINILNGKKIYMK